VKSEQHFQAGPHSEAVIGNQDTNIRHRCARSVRTAKYYQYSISSAGKWKSGVLCSTCLRQVGLRVAGGSACWRLASPAAAGSG
jgi:hypothetical protein